MMYDELKTISTERLLQRISEYSDNAIDDILNGDFKTAKSLLEDISFFSEYHMEVNLKTPDEYDEKSLELIDCWDRVHGL